jgi:hypothetical protein
MTTLEKIVKEAKTIKKNFPNKFAKWTDYIKEASKKFRSKTAPDKKKSNLGAVKKVTKKQVKKKLTSKKASDQIRAEVKSKKFIMPHGYEVRKSKLAGSKITPAEHYLSYAPSKPNEKAIYKGIERVKNNILRLQAMQKDHMFKKHRASLSGAINTKNKEIKDLLKKLK